MLRSFYDGDFPLQMLGLVFMTDPGLQYRSISSENLPRAVAGKS